MVLEFFILSVICALKAFYCKLKSTLKIKKLSVAFEGIPPHLQRFLYKVMYCYTVTICVNLLYLEIA